MNIHEEVRSLYKAKWAEIRHAKELATQRYNTAKNGLIQTEKARLLQSGVSIIRVDVSQAKYFTELTILIGKHEPLVSEKMYNLLLLLKGYSCMISRGHEGLELRHNYVKFFTRRDSIKETLGSDHETCQEKSFKDLLGPDTPQEYIEREVFEWDGRWAI